MTATEVRAHLPELAQRCIDTRALFDSYEGNKIEQLCCLVDVLSAQAAFEWAVDKYLRSL